MRVEVWRPRRRADGSHTRVVQDRPEGGGELRVAVHQDVPLAFKESVAGGREVPRDLLHPSLFGADGGAREVHAAGADLHDEEQVARDETRLLP